MTADHEIQSEDPFDMASMQLHILHIQEALGRLELWVCGPVDQESGTIDILLGEVTVSPQTQCTKGWCGGGVENAAWGV